MKIVPCTFVYVVHTSVDYEAIIIIGWFKGQGLERGI